MKNRTLTALLMTSLTFTVPQAARADAKDVLLGVIGGVIINEAARNQQSKKRKVKRVAKSSPKRAPAPATLNSQYVRAERIQIQSSLTGLGYNIGSIDGVLGRNSRNAIGQWQASRGEPRTGQLTRGQFVALTNPGFQSAPVLANRQLNRQEVVLLQQGLQRLGFYRSGIDGSNGPGTRGATTTFLATQGLNPATTTHVQTVVAVSQAAGIPAPAYLQQEAHAQFAAVQPQNQFGVPAGAAPQANPFGTAPAPQANPFGTAPTTQTAGFGAPAAQQPAATSLFGQPAAPQAPVAGGGVVAAAAPPTNALFGAPAPAAAPLPQQQANPAAGLFGGQQPVAPQQAQPAAPAPAQNLFQQAPQPQAPQPQSGGTALFASGTQQPQAAPQQPQSTLDVFALQPGTQPAAAPQVATAQQPLLPQAQPQQQQAGAGSALFPAPTTSPAVQTFAATGAQPAPSTATGSLDIFGSGSN